MRVTLFGQVQKNGISVQLYPFHAMGVRGRILIPKNGFGVTSSHALVWNVLADEETTGGVFAYESLLALAYSM